MNNDLITSLLMLASALSIVVNGSSWNTYRHRRHSNGQISMESDIDGSGNEEIEEEHGNGFEYEGLKGHGGLFAGFNWTKAELAKISMWHATAQHFKAAELVETKLAEMDSTQEFPREQIRSFLQKFQAPQSVRQLFNQQQLHRIRNLHRRHKVREINEIFYERLMQIDPMTRHEIMQYFTLSQRC